MTDTYVIEARELSKEYEGERVVDTVTLGLPKGDVKVIIGPSGSGKSTFLRCLSLLEPADSGEVRLDGEVIGRRQRRDRWVAESERQLATHRAEIGMVFQRFNLFPHMTAVDNVMCGLVEVRKTPKAEARERAREFLARVGLADRAHAYPAELSGGQQQRVAIARALVMHPRVMLFDEPTSALDAELVREVLDVIESLAASGMTMLIVTHELSFARRVATRVCMMDEGSLIEEATPTEFFSSPRNDRTRRFLRAMHE